MDIRKFISDIITECFSYVDDEDDFVTESMVSDNKGKLEFKTDLISVDTFKKIVNYDESFMEIHDYGDHAIFIVENK